MMPDYPRPPFASQKQPMPGTTDAMQEASRSFE